MDKKGVILLNVIIILLTIALIGASLAAFFSLVNLSARITANDAKAFYLAEAGMAHAVNIIREKALSTDIFEKKIGPLSLGDGTYEIRIDVARSVIVSTGRAGGSKKTLQLQYSTL